MINTKTPNIEFSAADRCDRCGAQAYMSATKESFELLFCLHDGKKHNLALEMDGWTLSYDVMAIERLVEPERIPV
jgi:hypothetical protein